MAKKIFHNRQAVFSLLLVILVITVALFAPFIAPNSPYTVNISEKFLPASSTYPLGTDQLGRCVFSRLVMVQDIH